MKEESDLWQRARDLVGLEWTRRLAEATERLPHRCVHNYRHPLDSRKRVEGEPNPHYNRISETRGLPVLQTIGLCMIGSENSETWTGTICEEPIDAKRCPLFLPARGKEEVLREFEGQLRDEAWVRENLPELSSLLWVLGGSPPALPWWRRLLFWALPLRVEPVLPPFDPALLLTEGSKKGEGGT